MATSAPLLEIRDLHVTFQKGKQIVNAVTGVNLQVAKGTTLGIVGESGSGKSTIARAIMQLTPITSGSILLEGTNLASLPANEMRTLRKEMQMVFQDPGGSLNEYMKVGDIITEPLLVHKVSKKSELGARAKKLLAQVGLEEEDAFRYPKEFSGGQKQRIAIARAISITPKLLVCDEPTSALDVSVQAKVLNLLSDLRDTLDLTIVFIAHDIAVVHHFCDEVAVMSKGIIIESGSVDEVIHQPKHTITQELVASSL